MAEARTTDVYTDLIAELNAMEVPDLDYGPVLEDDVVIGTASDLVFKARALFFTLEAEFRTVAKELFRIASGDRRRVALVERLTSIASRAEAVDHFLTLQTVKELGSVAYQAITFRNGNQIVSDCSDRKEYDAYIARVLGATALFARRIGGKPGLMSLKGVVAGSTGISLSGVRLEDLPPEVQEFLREISAQVAGDSSRTVQ